MIKYFICLGFCCCSFFLPKWKMEIRKQKKTTNGLWVQTCLLWNLWHTCTVQFRGHIYPGCGRGTPWRSLPQTSPLDTAPCRPDPAGQTTLGSASDAEPSWISWRAETLTQRPTVHPGGQAQIPLPLQMPPFWQGQRGWHFFLHDFSQLENQTGNSYRVSLAHLAVWDISQGSIKSKKQIKMELIWKTNGLMLQVFGFLQSSHMSAWN